MMPARACAFALAALLAACAAPPAAPPPEARPQLAFVDLGRFDHELAASLAAPQPRVEVSFYDRVQPSQLPERLQKWMAAIEAQGGQVRVTQPPPAPGALAARSPIMLLSALSALWSANKVVREAATEARFASARQWDAELLLRHDARGDVVLDKVVFLRRPS